MKIFFHVILAASLSSFVCHLYPDLDITHHIEKHHYKMYLMMLLLFSGYCHVIKAGPRSAIGRAPDL